MGITKEELDHLDIYLDFCAHRGRNTPYLVQCYLTIVEDTLREQLYFKSNKKYRYNSFAEVAANVYFDEEYMHRYMYGLALTSFLWPNHVGLARFFKETLPQQKKGSYLEVGPGHGYYLMTAMSNCSFDNFLGIDISKASIQQTHDIAEHFHPELKNRFKLKQADFITAEQLEPNSFDAIVMGEVLEHVEQPGSFLLRIAELAKKNAYIYVTTCINAPAIDHIYLWRDTDELEEMIRDNGLSIKHALRLPYDGKSLDESIQEGLAVNVAYALEKL
ncbi:class I SAM-dependent methyltransferase [Deltaproteobacteria bacterium]|nr:class I SAM-dependent methyltransferase [Deltaproteobacteria bacterium]